MKIKKGNKKKSNKKKKYDIIFYIYFSVLVIIAVWCCFYFSFNNKDSNQFINNSIDNNSIDNNVNIKKILFSKKSYSINVGDDIKVIPNVFPENVVNKKLIWTSSDKSVAVVDSDGVVKALSKGVSLIKAKSENGVTASYYIMVYEDTSNVFVPVYSLVIDKSDFELELNETTTLTVKFFPLDATNKNVLWLSSNNQVVKVGQDGVVTAVGYGNSVITVLSDNGKKATVKVSVKNKNEQVYENNNINVPEVPSINVVSSNELISKLNLKNISLAQVAVFSNGKVNNHISYGEINDNSSFPISSASKSILGIIAAKMQEDNIINLDTSIDKYWHQANGYDFNNCSSEWQKAIGSKDTFKKYTAASVDLVENKASLRNCLTHSSTIKNMNMVHMIPNDNSSEYFGGGMSKNYGVAAFMLSHTYHQLFEKNKVPGTKTDYNYLNDELTREHSLAGFTMQVAMKESINEYLNKNICNKIGCSSRPYFVGGNSIYFATYFSSSAVDLAKIISAVANDGVYNNIKIFDIDTIANIEKVEGHLKNQTIAFDYINGKYVKYGVYSRINGAPNYKLGDVSNNYATYITYDPKLNIGFVCNIKYNSKDNKNKSYDDFNNIASYFYSNSK